MNGKLRIGAYARTANTPIRISRRYRVMVNLAKEPPPLKNSVLPSEVPEAADVRQHKRKKVLVLVSCAEREPSDLYVEAAAIGVITHLRKQILELIFPNVVIRRDCRVKALP